MKLKRILLGLAALLISGAVLAQTVLPPFITGTNSEHRREIFEIGMLRVPILNNALTALVGGAQAGTALNLGYNRFTTVTSGNDSAQLPALTGGVVVVVTNAAASNTLAVFPQTGGIINAGSANAAFSVAAGKTAIFIQAVDTSGATIWYALLTA
jgi:hypothetical protein